MALPATIFPFPANWDHPVVESYGYRTNVITAPRDGSEQRIQLRSTPRGSISFHCAMLDSLSAQAAQALLYAAQPNVVGVPAWQYPEAITANVVATDTVLPVASTANNLFAVNQYGIIWASAFDFHAFTVSAVGASSVTISPAIPGGMSFTAGKAWVMPLLPARFKPTIPFDWHALAVGAAQLDFDVDEVPTMTGTTTFRTWQGYQLLEELVFLPNRNGVIEEDVTRSFAVLDNETGVLAAETLSLSPNPSRPYQWTCFSRAQVKPLRDFLDARKGRAIPFWIPSWQADLMLAADVSGAATDILVPAEIDYIGRYFPVGNARRHLHLRTRINPLSLDPFYAFVTTAVVDGDNHRLGFTTAVNKAYPADSLVSFLKLCRLSEDELDIVWRTPSTAECSLRVTELPNEAPVVT